MLLGVSMVTATMVARARILSVRMPSKACSSFLQSLPYLEHESADHLQEVVNRRLPSTVFRVNRAACSPDAAGQVYAAKASASMTATAT